MDISLKILYETETLQILAKWLVYIVSPKVDNKKNIAYYMQDINGIQSESFKLTIMRQTSSCSKILLLIPINWISMRWIQSLVHIGTTSFNR